MSSSDFEAGLLEGLAQLLNDTEVATWKDAGIYSADETGVVLGALPQAPDRVVGLLTYGVSDNPSLSDSVVGLQVTTRWGGQDPRPLGSLTGKVFDQLHGLHDVELATGVRVVQVLRKSWTSLGQDSTRRWRTVQNFYVDTHRPSPHRT